MADGMMEADFLRDLAAPFRDDQISWRVGSTSTKNPDRPTGMALGYIDARDVMERLDTVCGPAHWQDRYVETEKGRIICTLSIRIAGEWIEKSDGAGDSDVESEKGAISDALKRAAVKWGIGRYLYNLDSPWVEIEQRGKSWAMKASERGKLDKAHANFVKNNFKNAAPSDAGKRETPKSQQATGAEGRPPPSAPVQTMSKGDARADYGLMVEEMRRVTSSRELKEWGRMNAERVKLQPQDWQAELRANYQDLMEGHQHNERAAAEADREFEDAR